VRWNDKTIVLFDDFIVALNEGTTLLLINTCCSPCLTTSFCSSFNELQGAALNDILFELYDIDKHGNVVKQKSSGAWIIVDNGYLNWATTVPSMKASCKRPEIRFSQWLESIRKDVECTFGIMKGQFRILKTGIRLHGQQPADKIFRTCCALHNWLLYHADGLDKQWENGVHQKEHFVNYVIIC
jgi:hypothetical protein